MAESGGGGIDPGGGGEGTSRPPEGEDRSSPRVRRGTWGKGARGVRGSGGNRGNGGSGRPTGEASASTQGTSVPAPGASAPTPGGASALTQETSVSANLTIGLTGGNQSGLHYNTILDDEMDDSTLTNEDLHSTPKRTLTKKTTEDKKTPRKNGPTPPKYTVRGWTLNRDDKKMYNATGHSRIMTSEEWRAFQILDKQWRNKLEKQRNQHQKQDRTKNLPIKQKTTTTQKTVTQTGIKHKLSSDSTEKEDNKKSKTDDENVDMQTDQDEWEQQSIKHMTIRIQSAKTNTKLTQDDIQHINRVMMRALYSAAGGDLEKYRRLQPDKMSLLHPNLAIRLRLTSEEGIDFWRQFVPTIPPRMEGGEKYLFLGPGETLTEKVCFWVPDASFGEGKEADLELLTFLIKANNPQFEKVDFTLQSMGIDANTLQTIMIMELKTSDRETCLGPKPQNPTEKTDWKIKIGLSNVNVKIAFAKSDERRREQAQARLSKKNDDEKQQEDEKTNDKKDDELDENRIDELLQIDEDCFDDIIPGVSKITTPEPTK